MPCPTTIASDQRLLGEPMTLGVDCPGSRWLIFDKVADRIAFLADTRGRWTYTTTWTDVHGFGLHACVDRVVGGPGRTVPLVDVAAPLSFVAH